METFIEHLTYAVLTFFEGCVVLLTLGYYTPNWTTSYLSYIGKRNVMQRQRGSNND